MELQGVVTSHYSAAAAVDKLVRDLDVVIGTVLSRRSRAAHPASRAPGRHASGGIWSTSPIDRGDCVETSPPTALSALDYVVDGIVESCVTSMPSAVPVTSRLDLITPRLPTCACRQRAGSRLRSTSSLAWRPGLNIAGGDVLQPVVALELDRALAAAG